MVDLKTTYMGIELKNPIIIGSNNLVTDSKNAVALEAAGAAALVYKSLFEEQIQLESYEMDRQMDDYNERNAEMTTLFPDLDHAGPQEHILNLKKIKQSVKIPVFASLNCVNNDTWVEWAKQIEATGVDGLELNFYHVPIDSGIGSELIIQEQIDIAAGVVKAIKIPVAVKLSPFYTNPLNMVKRFESVGVKAVVLFNSLFQPDIDIKEQKLVYKYNFSNEGDNRLPLRYAALLYGHTKTDVCSSRGIFNGGDIVKMLLAGANNIQTVSSIYKNGFDVVTQMLEQLSAWMKENNYKNIDQFKGNMSKLNIKNPFAYKRAQYVDILMRSDNVMNEEVLR